MLLLERENKMKIKAFAKRNFMEIMRDPISLAFSMGLPLFLLIIFQQFEIPSEVYNINNFTPSIVIFSFCFITLFSSQLIAKDRTSSFLTRLFASPMTAKDFILGYSLALFPIIILQSVLFFGVAVLLGLDLSINILYTILLLLPVSVMFIGLGFLIGCSFNDKTTPGVSSIIIQLVAFTSGMWFDISTMDGAFATVCKLLPFKYSVDLARFSLAGNFSEVLKPFLIVLCFTIVIFTISVLVFKRKMNSDSI